MKKFTMELVWHNCYEHPPKEDNNDNLYITNGTWVHRAEYSSEDGWYDFRTGNYIPFELKWEYWWADMEQTVRGDHRFKGLFVDDLVDYLNAALSMKPEEHWTLKDGLLYKEND